MVEKLILGTVQFGLDYGINNSSGQICDEDVKQILDYAYSKGIRILDTADAYGNATNIIGAYHRNSKNTFKVISKFNLFEGQIEPLKVLLDNALKRLNIQQIFGYLYHSYGDFKKHNYTLNQLEELKAKGQIKYIGVSIYTNEQFEELLTHDAVDIIQLPYNLLDNYNQRGLLMKCAKELGKIIHVRSVFLQGLLFKSLNTLPETLFPLKVYLQDIRNIAKKYQIGIAELAITYALSNPNIDGLLIGVDNLEQLKINVASVEQTLPKEAKEEIDAITFENTFLLNPSTWS